MTKQQLEFFLSAAEFSNLSRAAAFHYVSIPTFTRHINDLEEELNTKLFIRTNRGLSLTQAGALFHPIAQKTLDHLYEYADVITNRGLWVEKPVDKFILGYYPFGGMFPHYAQLIDRYLSILMKMPCKLRCIGTGKMTEMVYNGIIDVGAVSMSTIAKYGDAFESRLFFRNHGVLMVDKDHELAGRDNISLNELKEKYGDYSLYLPADEKHEQFIGKKIQDKMDIRKICINYLDLLPWLTADQMDENNHVVPRMIIGTSSIQRPELSGKHVLNIENGNVTMEVRLFWRKDNDSEAIRRFKNALDFAEIK